MRNSWSSGWRHRAPGRSCGDRAECGCYGFDEQFPVWNSFFALAREIHCHSWQESYCFPSPFHPWTGAAAAAAPVQGRTVRRLRGKMTADSGDSAATCALLRLSSPQSQFFSPIALHPTAMRHISPCYLSHCRCALRNCCIRLVVSFCPL